VLFTHSGLSGPGILDISRFVEPGDTLCISLVPADHADAIEDRIAQDIAGFGGKPLRALLKRYGIPSRLVGSAANTAGIDLDQSCSGVTKNVRRLLEDRVVRHTFVVDHVEGFDRAMATRGGVSLDEVVSKTMQSRLVPGLFFAGEVLDIDGDTGGYNLQFAFSSGWIAGKNAAEQ
jgi:predicted Rossmann fold flavoprotein